MRVDMRREPRQVSGDSYSVCWQDQNGLTHSAQMLAMDVSRSGLGVRGHVNLAAGTTVYLQSQSGAKGYAVVRHVTPYESSYILGLELNDETKESMAAPASGPVDHYEFLQISP